MELMEEIQSLIALKTEGDYWDFKEMWHDNKASLLHDIICMANNQVGRDAYIIFGVSDSKSPDGVKVKGVQETGRKDQQHLIDFLRDKKFAGGVRPSVYLQTLEIPDEAGAYKQVDVAIIKNSNKTPFFLTDTFQYKGKEVRSGHIYTRIGDTNTAIDSMADLDKIEYLWRKRFGLDLSAVEKLLSLLDSPDDWAGDLNNSDYKYHRLFPEFQIRIVDIQDQSQFSYNDIMKYIASHQADKTYSVSDVVVMYHSTVVYREHVLYLDGSRHLIPYPMSNLVCVNKMNPEGPALSYLYLNMDSIPGKLFDCFACAKNNWYYQKWDLLPGVAFLVFQDKAEQKQFDEFVLEQLPIIEVEYIEALQQKQYVYDDSTAEYFVGGWSKANEIKSRYLYEKFKGIKGKSLFDRLPRRTV